MFEDSSSIWATDPAPPPSSQADSKTKKLESPPASSPLASPSAAALSFDTGWGNFDEPTPPVTRNHDNDDKTKVGGRNEDDGDLGFTVQNDTRHNQDGIESQATEILPSQSIPDSSASSSPGTFEEALQDIPDVELETAGNLGVSLEDENKLGIVESSTSISSSAPAAASIPPLAPPPVAAAVTSEGPAGLGFDLSLDQGQQMDAFDDFDGDLGAAKSGTTPKLEKNTAVNEDDGFGDDGFDDFGTSAASGADDDFGDFGDFDDGMTVGAGAGDETAASSLVAQPIASAPSHPPVRLPPPPLNYATLLPITSSLISSIFPSTSDPSAILLPNPEPSLSSSNPTDPFPLPSTASKALYDHLTGSPMGVSSAEKQRSSTTGSLPSSATPMVQWQRSLTRRSYLQALGLPINLEDFLKPPQKPMKKLSLNVGGTSSSGGKRGSGPSSAPVNGGSSNRRGGSDVGDGRPEIDRKRADELLEIGEDYLALQSLKTLRSLRSEIQNISTTASSLLTHGLQVKDKERQDGEAYNRRISELISSAAKLKTTSSSGSHRSSLQFQAQSQSSRPGSPSSGQANLARAASTGGSKLKGGGRSSPAFGGGGDKRYTVR